MLSDSLYLIIAMGLVALAWLALSLTAAALGCGLARMMGIHEPSDPFPRFWCGIGLLVAFVQVWNFFLPIDLYALCAAMLTGILWAKNDLLHYLSYLGKYIREHIWSTSCAALFAAWVANRCIGPILFGDSGEYHISQIAWATQHPLVTGLANLDFFLANNTSCLLMASLVDVGPLHLHSMMIFNGLLTIATMWQAFAAVAGIHDSCQKMALRYFYLALPCILIEFAGSSVSASTDYAAGLLVLQCFPLIYRFCSHYHPDQSARHNIDLPIIIFILMAAVCMKQTVVFFAATATLILVMLFIYRQHRHLQMIAKVIVHSFVLSCLVLIPWFARSVVICGYPLFPSALLPFPVEWRVPAEIIRHYQSDISYHTNYLLLEIPDDATPMQWYAQYTKRLLTKGRVMVVIPTVMFLMGILLLILLRKPGTLPGMGITSLSFCCFISLIIWLHFAPQLRYAYFIFWGLAGMALGLSIEQIDNKRWQKLLALGILCCSLGIGFAVVVSRHINTRHLEVDDFGTPIDRLCYGPGPYLGFHNQLFRRDPGNTKTTRHGLQLIVREGHQFLWDSALPNTRFYNKNLKLVDPSDIRSGFRVVGEPNDPLHGWGDYKGLPR